MACTKQSGRGAARRAGYTFSTISTKFYVWYFYFFIYLLFLALYVFRELRLAAYRDRIAAACTVCTFCYAKYRVRTACTSLLITGDQGDKMKNNCVNF